MLLLSSSISDWAKPRRVVSKSRLRTTGVWSVLVNLSEHQTETATQSLSSLEVTNRLLSDLPWPAVWYSDWVAGRWNNDISCASQSVMRNLHYVRISHKTSTAQSKRKWELEEVTVNVRINNQYSVRGWAPSSESFQSNTKLNFADLSLVTQCLSSLIIAYFGVNISVSAYVPVWLKWYSAA